MIKLTDLVNCTDHEIWLCDENRVLQLIVPPSGTVIRIEEFDQAIVVDNLDLDQPDYAVPGATGRVPLRTSDRKPKVADLPDAQWACCFWSVWQCVMRVHTVRTLCHQVHQPGLTTGIAARKPQLA